MHTLCTRYAHDMNTICTGYAQAMHMLCTGSYAMHTLCTRLLHSEEPCRELFVLHAHRL